MQRGALAVVGRRSILVGAGALVAGCLEADGEDSDGSPAETDDTDRDNSEVNGMGDLTLESTAFDDGERIPEQYGYDAENANPPLQISGVPDDAESLALIVDDPDAVEPAGKVWDHWVVWNIPPETAEIPEGWEPTDAEEGTNDFGEVGYGGPSPPDREHTYQFRLYALDTTPDLPTETGADDLEEAIEGHVLEDAHLEGTYPA